jgi:hypothetical protein
MTTPTTVAGKWGPIAFAVSQMAEVEDLHVALSVINVHQDAAFAARQEKLTQYRKAVEYGASFALRESLYGEYEELDREIWALSGWYHATQAAYYFAQHGCGSSYLSEVVEIELVTLPDPHRADHL